MRKLSVYALCVSCAGVPIVTTIPWMKESQLFIPISKMEKRYTNFGQNGGEIWKIIEIGIDMYIYSWSGGKNKTNILNQNKVNSFVK